jgi:hypothetical protein
MNAEAVRRGRIFGAAALLLVVQACGSAPSASAAPPPTAVASPSAEPSPTPIPSLSPPPAPPPPAKPEPVPAVPASLPVSFYALPTGMYPVHLHSVCSGAQNFHVTVVQSLSVGSGGSGSIQVPSSYFGRGLCVIVYTSNALSRVLATRRI